MAKKNGNLHAAKAAKNDEFYTRLCDIEEELQYYKGFFRGKCVYCNYDDPMKSNFFKYFHDNFMELGLERLIATCYNPDGGHGSLCDYHGDGEVEVVPLEGDGDFRSEECVAYLKECDVVVTNPPFSLFREYVKQLMGHGKKFLVIGNMNSIICKEIFPYIKWNKLWYGPSISSGDRAFYVPETYPLNAAGCGIDENGKRYIKVKGVRWFTNIEHETRKHRLTLSKVYSEHEYQKYDNFDAIEVGRVADIPMDYNGIMGVPITFLDKYCPEQFEILDAVNRYLLVDIFNVNEKVRSEHGHCANVKGKPVYIRLLIRKKLVNG